MLTLRRLWLRDDKICWLCESEVEKMRDASRDHVLARSKGGPNEAENLRLAHKFCNEVRGNVPDRKFAAEDYKRLRIAYEARVVALREKFDTVHADREKRQRAMLSHAFISNLVLDAWQCDQCLKMNYSDVIWDKGLPHRRCSNEYCKAVEFVHREFSNA